MKLDGMRESKNVDDRRGMSPGTMLAGGGGLGVIILLLLFLFTGDENFARLMQQQAQAPAANTTGERPAPDDTTRKFISVILASTEDVWTEQFQKHTNRRYIAPELVIFDGPQQTGCGPADPRMGPFYCPADEKVYIPPSFFVELARSHGAPGEFPQAYVIAHEISHHVQKLLGYTDLFEQARRRGNKIEANRALVRLELQADYMAGVWAHHAHRQYEILDQRDISQAIKATSAIGDDTLMEKAGRYADPREYTHGTSEQRTKWFIQGLKTGDFTVIDQFFKVNYDDLEP
ncbi:MAG: neutral zinc metallopeptidase [Pirellulaceae bacterium]|nr:neutral zinc metallopeptidase [Pirellulaceae bacterium]